MKENWLKIFLKGLCVGGTMLVPGVSGGSMAMILGIYDKLITSVSSFFACKKRNALFLLLFALGGGAGCEHDERVILLPAKGGNGAEIGGAQVGKTKSVLTPSGLHQMDAGGFQRYEPVIKLFITQDVLEICLCCQ